MNPKTTAKSENSGNEFSGQQTMESEITQVKGRTRLSNHWLISKELTRSRTPSRETGIVTNDEDMQRMHKHYF